MQITPAPLPSGDVRVYEFGARLDKDCLRAADEQFFKAQRLYNAMVACMQATVRDMQSYLLEQAGPEARVCQVRVDQLNEAFAAARATNDEERMKTVAQERREAWRELAALLKDTRKACRTPLQANFLSRIGKKATCQTYQLRCQAVADGLGWATANQTLDAALIAFKKSFALGKAPRFARAGESVQDTLTLQFTAAGGVSVKTLLEGKHTEFAVKAEQGCGPKKYGSFRFRLGAASQDIYASGTWQYHRPLPEDGAVGLVRLVRRRVDAKFRWYIQFQVRSPLPAVDVNANRKPLVTVHPGWAADLSGRRIAGIADAGDPGLARVLQLPVAIEQGLALASEIESVRSDARDTLHVVFKEYAWPEDVLAAGGRELDGLDADEQLRTKIADDILGIKRLPAQHVAIRRLHRLAYRLRAINALPDWLEAWRAKDKLQWQTSAHAAKRARNRRRKFYQATALALASQYSAIVLESLDLAAAAKKVDEVSGERTDLARKARSGRVVAAIYEFDSSIRWAATKCGTALLELSGETAQHCAYCGGKVAPVEGDSQTLHCHDCGADIDRKRNGAALAWQAAEASLETHVEDFWRETLQVRAESEAKRSEKKEKLASGRKASRVATENGVEASS